MEHTDHLTQAYKLLGAPLPIRSKPSSPVSSLLPFLSNQPPHVLDPRHPEEPLGDSLFGKRPVHDLGDTIASIFATPIYKSHSLLQTDDNDHFGSCSLGGEGVGAEMNEVSQDCLQFSSRFESGNLAVASTVDKKSYYLAAQRDCNSASQTTQWFYFRVRNRSNLGEYAFHIINLVKPFSTFQSGMKPCVYSLAAGKGWVRGGHSVDYRRNSLPYGDGKNYHTLTFKYDFNLINDDIYFAYCYPYTYTRLTSFLDSIQTNHSDKMRRKVIAKTAAGNAVQMVSITNPLYKHKKVMFICARVHPGETVSSFICEALIEFLLSGEAEKMRSQFIVKVVPMLNPDGVVHGNYRANLSGDDLNRYWKNPDKVRHVEVYNLKKMIQSCELKKVLFIDLHGHSKKKGCFLYGCVTQRQPYLAKELPYLLSKNSPQFHFHNCNFAIPKAKEGTSRITIFRSCGVDYSYTLEASFCGPLKQKRHYTQQDYRLIALDIGRNVSDYFYSRILELEINASLEREFHQFYSQPHLLEMGNQDTHGSSSELEEEGPKDIVETKVIVKEPKKIKMAPQKTESSQDIRKFLEECIVRKTPNKRVLTIKTSREAVEKEKKQREEKREEGVVRQRQSLLATKVNIQQMDQRELSRDFSVSLAERNIRQPFFTETRRPEKARMEETMGILFPSVQKGQYKKYERYKQSEFQQRSNSVYLRWKAEAPNGLLLPTNRSQHQITLVERIRSVNK